jgi:hypothetical protein
MSHYTSREAIAITGYTNAIYKTAINISGQRLIEAETPAALHDDNPSVFQLLLQTSSRPLVEPAPSPPPPRNLRNLLPQPEYCNGRIMSAYASNLVCVSSLFE